MTKWRTKQPSALDALRGSTRWRQLREAVLRSNPLCAVCAEKGIAYPADEVHHIIPAAEMVKRYGEEGFYAVDNLVPLCRRCHDRNEDAWRQGLAEVLFPKSRRGIHAEKNDKE